MNSKKKINPLFLVAAIILLLLIIITGRPLAQAELPTASPTPQLPLTPRIKGARSIDDILEKLIPNKNWSELERKFISMMPEEIGFGYIGLDNEIKKLYDISADAIKSPQDVKKIRDYLNSLANDVKPAYKRLLEKGVVEYGSGERKIIAKFYEDSFTISYGIEGKTITQTAKVRDYLSAMESKLSNSAKSFDKLYRSEQLPDLIDEHIIKSGRRIRLAQKTSKPLFFGRFLKGFRGFFGIIGAGVVIDEVLGDTPIHVLDKYKYLISPETREIILEGLNQTEFENQKARNALDEAIKGEEMLKKQLEQYEKEAILTPIPL